MYAVLLGKLLHWQGVQCHRAVELVLESLLPEYLPIAHFIQNQLNHLERYYSGPDKFPSKYHPQHLGNALLEAYTITRLSVGIPLKPASSSRRTVPHVGGTGISASGTSAQATAEHSRLARVRGLLARQPAPLYQAELQVAADRLPPEPENAGEPDPAEV